MHGMPCANLLRGTCLANKLFLKKWYFRAEIKEGTFIEAHLKEMKEITDKLTSIGAPISELGSLHKVIQLYLQL